MRRHEDEFALNVLAQRMLERVTCDASVKLKLHDAGGCNFVLIDLDHKGRKLSHKRIEMMLRILEMISEIVTGGPVEIVGREDNEIYRLDS